MAAQNLPERMPEAILGVAQTSANFSSAVSATTTRPWTSPMRSRSVRFGSSSK
jgi:hypothetical protein